jgi:hypothetical protein
VIATELEAKAFNLVKSGKTVRVNVARTWDLVRQHRIYSRPADTHADISDAAFLLLDAGSHKQTMKVVGVWKFDPRGERPETVPLEWHKRLEDYIAAIAQARDLHWILDQPRDYFFFGLAKGEDNDSWPDWLQQMVDKKDLVDQAALALWTEKELFFHWPCKAELLWRGVIRHHDGYRQDCYTYPEDVKSRLGQEPDGRNNGPAIHAFELSGGECPKGWHIHHVYDGRVLIPGTSKPILHAVNNPDHFTHSGGLVAAHPAAHFVAHESELLGWLLRWEAFKRLNFDPDNIFGGRK